LSLKIDVLLVPSNQPVGGRKNGLVHRPTGGLKRALCACASIAAILSALLPGSAFGATSLLGAGAPPAISSVSPVSGPASGGTPVTIIGTDFTGATAVTFGSADAVGFTVDSTTQITAISPAGSGTVVLAITTPDGTSSTSGFDSFSYTPAPAVSSVSPASGPESGGTSVAITGNDLAGATDVDFGATAAAAFTVDSATQITATSPAGSGTVHVTVTTPGGTSAAGSDDSFAYFGQPAVSAVAPNAGPTAGGTSVIITGTNFGGASAVSFGLAAATSFTIDSSTQITATSPAGTGTVDVRVVTPGGTSATSGADNFSYLVAPTVTGVTPSTGPAAGGTAVTITGTDLTGATDVSFGGSAAIFTVDSSTQISATSPAGSGTVDITVTTAGGTSATSPDDQFIFTPPPTVTSVSPNSGSAVGGTSVTITGTGFAGATAVSFGASAATTFTVDDSTHITATSPAGSGTVDVIVTTSDGTSVTAGADHFSYVGTPTVTGVDPNAGPLAGGTSVIITGTGLSGASAVDFGSTAATSFIVDSATQITATSPAGSAGPVDVTVTTLGGTSSTSAADNFTYVAAPAVSSVTPSAGPTGGGTSVTITGTDLTGATAVSFGASAATTFTVDSATQITATSPAGSIGSVDVTVTAVGGTSSTSSADQFSYVAAPTVTGVSPSGGPDSGGTSVTITGTDFTNATVVSFGASAATTFTVDSSTQITATSPVGSGTVAVTVTTAGGTSATTVDDEFTYTGSPTVTSVSPASGPTAGGTSVTITGTNFAGASAVDFGSTAATSFIVDSATQVTATSPAGSAGPVDVTVTTLGGTSGTSAADNFTYVAAPTVSSVAPSAGPTSGGTSVTITGTDFTGATALSFGSSAATTFTVDSATQITATSPAGSAGPVDVTVTTLGGTSGTSASDNFTYVAAPTVSSVTPSAGPTGGGTSVTITGTDLTGATAVSFGASAATTFTVDSATQITATSPAGSIGSVDVTLTAVGGTSSTSSADQFSYVAAPTVTGVSPSGGPDAGGTSVTITGTDFTDATGVSFGSSPASTFNVDSATQITATSPSGSGTVQVTVTTDGGTSVTSSADQFTYSDICTSASVDAGGASSAVIGAVVHLVAGSTGCPVPTYEFWLQRPTGKWSVAQPFGGNIWDWNTTGYAAGVYTIHVWANQSGHSTRTWEAFGELIFRLNSMAGSCTTAGLLPISGSPEQLAGADVAFTATSGGCTSPMYEYWVGSTNGTWTLTRSFSSAPSWTWHTTGKAPGVYEIHVWANQTGHSKSVWEAFASSTVTLTGCTSATLDPTTASAAAGESIAMTAHSGGCPNPQYEFWVGYPNGTWHLIQGFGSASFNWSTHGLAPGEYEVHVWANQQGASTSTFEAFGSSTVTLTGCTSVTLSPASGSTPRGGSVTFTAMNPLGCPHPVYELWTLGPSHVWRLLIPFSSASSWTLPIPRNGTPGTYTLHVWANNANSSYKAYEAVGSATRKIT
jgi:hypothetical protein